MFELVANKKKGLCKVRFCRNRGHQGRSLCCKHAQQKWRRNNPIISIFNIIMARAKRSKVDFTLTKEEFFEFCRNTGYLTKQGIHIDRKDATEGYHLWNIQALGGRENIIKGNKERHSPRYQEYLRKKKAEEEGIDCPF